MKGYVPGLVAEDQAAHIRDGRVIAVVTDHPIVARADDLDDEQNQHLKLGIKQASALIEESKGIAVFHQRSVETGDGSVEQATVFLFFGKPEINDFTDVVIAGSQGFRIRCDEPAGTSAIPELIFGE